jgi:two-component system phosphate regulon sensor histidine kinase PhoR
MRPLLQKICEEFSALTMLEEIVFSFELEAGNYLIKGESSHLENAINNLLDNAKKYSDQPVIRLRAHKEKKKLIITVVDNGRGISKKDLPRIFQKYYRVPNGNLHKVTGYGLGLSYVKKVLEEHKAKISVESEVHIGTTIIISIPLVNEERT